MGADAVSLFSLQNYRVWTLQLVVSISPEWAQLSFHSQSQNRVRSSLWMSPLPWLRSSSPAAWLPRLNSHWWWLLPLLLLLLLQSRAPAPDWLWTLLYPRNCPLCPALWI